MGKSGRACSSRRRQQLHLAALIEVYRYELDQFRAVDKEIDERLAELSWTLCDLTESYLRLLAV